MAATTKDARLNLRLRHAADQTGQSVTEFLTTSAIERAHEVLADQRRFVLDEATWDEFVALLDAPVHPTHGSSSCSRGPSASPADGP
jgi:uncharacterized protein (DUF1778 family)